MMENISKWLGQCEKITYKERLQTPLHRYPTVNFFRLNPTLSQEYGLDSESYAQQILTDNIYDTYNDENQEHSMYVDESMITEMIEEQNDDTTFFEELVEESHSNAVFDPKERVEQNLM